MIDRVKPLVSVCCTAYNQEELISEAIESFLMQETDFDYEIIIHDDASTDSTAEIIRRYMSLHPMVVRGIFQEENQYSNQKNIPSRNVWSAANGQYIAICEGDDYWTDRYKLQNQINAMARHPNCKISFHGCRLEGPGGKGRSICNYGEERIFTLEEVIVGGGAFMATASIVFCREVVDDMPSWYWEAPVGDYYLQVIASIDGGALFLPSEMACYRYMLPGSWSDKEKGLRREQLQKVLRSHLRALESLNEFIPYQVDESIEVAKAHEVCRIATNALLLSDYQFFKGLVEQSWSLSRKIHFKQVMLFYGRFFPSLLKNALLLSRKTRLFEGA